MCTVRSRRHNLYMARAAEKVSRHQLPWSSSPIHNLITSPSRGPAKGYIEGLEHRLHEAESLLLQILPHVSAEQLQAATLALANNDSDESGRISPDRRSSPPILNKKTGIDYWENFPLTSVNSIRRWQQDCEIHSLTAGPSSSNRSTVKTEARNASPHSLHGEARSSRGKQPSSSGVDQRSLTPYGQAQGESNTMDDLVYTMQGGDQNPAQVIQAQNNEIQMTLDRQRQNSWQASMMNVNPQMSRGAPQQQNRGGIPQQQPFMHVGYMNSSNQNSWQMHQPHMDMNMGNTHHAHDESMPAVSSQTHSHLFW